MRVYFEDTDLSGVVYHANYLRYMERARSDMLRAAGIDQRAAHEAGEGAYAIRDLAIRYRAPARLDDALMVVDAAGRGPRGIGRSFINESCAATMILTEARGDGGVRRPDRAGRAASRATWVERSSASMRQGEQDRMESDCQHRRRDAVSGRAVPAGRLGREGW